MIVTEPETPQEALEFLQALALDLRLYKGVSLIDAVKMVVTPRIKPEDNAPFSEYQEQAKPNVIFGVLTNGEIFVEVNGHQHTPCESFYKMATIQSTKLAHQVRDLQIELSTLKASQKPSQAEKLTLLRKENKQLKIIVGNIICELKDGGAL